MSRNSAPRHNYPDRKRKEYVRDYPLEELFSDDALLDKLAIAGHRILKAFDLATYKTRGKWHGTDNFIVGVGPRQKHLVEYVMQRIVRGMNSGIVYVTELPEELGNVKAVLGEARRNAERRLIAVRLDQLVQIGEIWFDEQTPGTWNICTSAMDRYRHNIELIESAKFIDEQLRRERLHNGRLRVVH